jgi:hypothetical protein
VASTYFGEPGELLYHYTTLMSAVIHILPTRRMRLSPFTRMRDPREAKDWSQFMVGYDPDWLTSEAYA